MDLSGRTALITGATGGLGKIISKTLAEIGANLILVDKPNSNFEPLLNLLNARTRPDIRLIECDLEDEHSRSDLISTINSELQSLSILINNAAFVGTSNLTGWSVPFEEQSLETWRRAIEVNLTSIFDLTKGFVPLMKKSTGATIINIASIYGSFAPDWSLYEGTSMGNPAAYASSKGGLIQLTRWLASTVAPQIRVNAISPGGILRNQPGEFVERYSKKTLLGRMATEEDFIGPIAFLASDLSRYVTGQNIRIDGGWNV
jgi:NAD(P)-dependent dehydrogenase (short-subunit alcohol dehydrogenase family)